MPAPKKTGVRRDLDGDGDVDLSDDPSRDLDHNGRIESDDREEYDLDADHDIDATDRTLAEKKSVGAALGMAKTGQKAESQGQSTAGPKAR